MGFYGRYVMKRIDRTKMRYNKGKRARVANPEEREKQSDDPSVSEKVLTKRAREKRKC